MDSISQINVNSEIGKLVGVILHTPGEEVEKMNPENAAGALYSDIINLPIAQKEYKQIEGVLSKITKTYQVKDLLTNILKDEKIKLEVLNRIEKIEPNIIEFDTDPSLKETLFGKDAKELARLLIEGVEIERDNFTRFLSKDWFALKPMHNFYFTRDASMSIYNEVLVGRMANFIREREGVIMRSIFDFTPGFNTKTVTIPAINKNNIEKRIRTIEGGDVLIAREDILVIGSGVRSTPQAIDVLAEHFINKNSEKIQHIIIQQLPSCPESFIHMDMVFTLLDKNKCMAYKPLILHPDKYQTVHMAIQKGKIIKLESETNVISALKKLGMDLEVVSCGGSIRRNQDREQWHSGANFFSVAPGKVIGYERNNYTIEAMNNAGFEVIKANDVIQNKIDLSNYNKYVITLEGSELPRGGGGARCMTMPINRENVIW